MMQQSRTSRIGLVRRILLVEALEDLTLLNGVVTAVLDPAGVLQITGDSEANQFTLAPSPTAGMIRISGDADTSTLINGEAFVDFSLAAITDILMTLEEGQDNATLTDFSIPGNLTIHYGNITDVFTMPNFSANTINLVFAGLGEVTGSGHNGDLLPLVGAGGSGNNGGLLPPLG